MSAARMCDNCNKSERVSEYDDLAARTGYVREHPLPEGWQRVVAGRSNGIAAGVDIDACSDHCAVEGLRKALQ